MVNNSVFFLYNETNFDDAMDNTYSPEYKVHFLLLWTPEYKVFVLVPQYKICFII
jgi:hypothetical protein